ncbi:MAG: membrane dipeptidase [Ignavibacteriae bacterium]|nr:membrane dipeptidase [Ignavibacteriota bacterium]
MKIFLTILFLVVTNLASVSNNEGVIEKDEKRYSKAIELSKKLLIIDTHIDIPYRLKNNWEDISQRTEGGHFDYPRAIEGGLNAAFMSIFIPARYEKEGGSVELADSLIDLVENLAKDYPKKFVIAHSANDVINQFSPNVISFPLGMENGTPIQNSFENLKHFYDRGVRYITLAHGKANHICDSSYDPNKKWNGLSPFGKTLIPEMNKLGIMVDISHVSDSTFYQVLELTNAPVIASHSSCRHFTSGFERNMNDDMIKKLAENNGVIQITFGSYFVSGDYNSKMTEMSNYLKEHSIGRWSEEGKKYYAKFKEENNIDYGTTEDLVNHIDHVVKLVGIEHVGLGSDFDGIGALPEGIKDVSSFPEIIYELLKKNYTEKDIKKICSENILRVWKEVEEISKKSSK